MSDLIERGEVFKALWARHKHEGVGLDALITMEDALDAVVSIPAVDVVDGDLISRAALLDDIDSERQILIESGRAGAEHVVAHHARRLIEDAPTVDAVEVKHGTWKIIGLDGNFVYCSVCHADQSKAHVTDCDGVVVLPYFCPVCGAKMDGGEKDAEERDTKEAAADAKERGV